MSAGSLMAGLRVCRPVGVLLPWGVIAVAAPWPMGTQPPLVMQVLTNVTPMKSPTALFMTEKDEHDKHLHSVLE